MTILTKDRTGANLDIAAENRAGIEYPLTHLIDADGTKIDPATEATLAALNVTAAAVKTAVEAINTKTTAINTGAIAGTVALDAPTLAALETINANTGGLTDAQLRAAAVPVSGPLTDAQLRASGVPVTGTFWQATQPVSFTWTGLTDAQLRASAVPVSGPLTDAQLRAAEVPVSGTFWQPTQPVSAASLPLPAGAATEATLAARLPALVTSVPMDHSAGMPVRQIPADLWRCSFSDVGAGLQTTDLTALQTGAGQAISQSTGNLVITSGTTANAETLIRSTRTFNGAMQLRYKTILSQRIINNNFSVELADLVGEGLAYVINSATSVTVTFPAGTNPYSAKNVGQFTHLSCITGAAGIPGRFAVASASGDTVTFTVAAWPASGSGTLMLWGWNYFRALYTGTTATNVAFDAQRKGWATGDSTLTINTTAAPGHVGHIQSNASLAAYSDALVATNAAYQVTPRGSRIENIPDDDDPLYLFIRVLNGTTAPASTTTWTIGFLSVEMTGRQKVYVSGADQNGAPFATAVQVVGGNLGTQAVSGTVTATVGTSITGGVISPLTVAGASAEASSAKTASGNSAAGLTNASGRNAHFIVNVSAFAGTTPTLVVRVQIQDPVSSTWVDLAGAVTGTITGTGATLLSVSNLPRTYRLAWVIGGATPSFTFSVGMLPVI